MSDNFLDFVEKHRTLIKILLVLIIVVIVCLSIRGCNMSKKKKEAEEFARQQAIIQAQMESTQESEEPEPTEESSSSTSYESSIGLGQHSDGRVTYTEPEPEPQPTVEPERKPSYKVEVLIWDNTAVPEKAVNGANWKGYLSNVSLKDFGTYWGSALTEEDYTSQTKYKVGVKQNRMDTEYGDLQSVGWLIENLSSMSDDTAIKFTNLHVIGSLIDDHVALLCAYDWYSAHGLDSTLVVFEDISGTLSVDDFHDGDIFSATVFRHNTKLEKVNGQTVVCVEYNTY